MKVHLLEGLIDQFVRSQMTSKDTSWYLPHSLVEHFHSTWFSAEPYELIERYDFALKSDISQRWWKRENYRPKEIMLKLISTDTELATIAFKDLANDAATLEGRLSRFDFYCTELLQMHRSAHMRDIETYHHQDASILSLYLAGWFPDKYALYPGLDIFQRFCAAVGSPDIPVVDDLTRYSKVAAIVFKFLSKHDEFSNLLKKRVEEHHRVKCLPFQTVFEIISMNDGLQNRFA